MTQQGPPRAARETESLSEGVSSSQALAQAQSAGEREGVRQQREILHQAARKVLDFCAQDGVSRMAVGDVRDIQTGVSLGRKTNQKISQWPHGQFARSLAEKAARLGMVVEWIDEAYSTRTCSVSGHIQP